MKIIKRDICISISTCITAILFMLFASCSNNLTLYENTPTGNFDALWQIIDERYCFFDYKKVDWNAVKDKYRPRVSDKMSDEALFSIVSEMLDELRDGHVNIFSVHNSSRYAKWRNDYPDNFNLAIQKKYLGDNPSVAGGFRYNVLENNIGYVYYPSFNNIVSDGTLDYILNVMAICDGVIIDVRDNGGGRLDNVDKIASRFFKERTLIGYMSHKIGKGHNEFSELFPKYIEPSKNNLKYQKPVAILTNRGCYSATNEFVNVMKNAPNVTIIGDQTGGGSGFPLTYELPNGWLIRLSSSPIFNVNKEHLEFGIKPDIEVSFPNALMYLKIDPIIEKACEILKEKAFQKK